MESIDLLNLVQQRVYAKLDYNQSTADRLISYNLDISYKNKNYDSYFDIKECILFTDVNLLLVSNNDTDACVFIDMNAVQELEIIPE